MSRSMRSTDFPSRGSRRACSGQTPLPRARRRRLLALHDDLARDASLQSGGCAFAHELRLPRPGGGRGDFGEPEIRRAAMPLARCGRDISVRRDQRKLAFERLLGGEHDAQGRALPRRHRRGEHGKPGLVLASVDWCLRLRLGLGRALGGKSRVEAASAQAISNDAIAAAVAAAVNGRRRAGNIGTPLRFRRRTQEYPEMLGAIMANCTPPVASANRRTAPRRGRDPSWPWNRSRPRSSLDSGSRPYFRLRGRSG